MMTPIKASRLAVMGFGIPPAPTSPTEARTCAACGDDLHGQGVAFKVERSFNDVFQFADQSGRTVCGCCRALMLHPEATSKGGSGVVSATGFTRLLTNRSRVQFLVAPPESPFAVAIVNAKRQHVWWMARVAYDRDVIPVQFGHRPLIVDRRRAIATADAILEYEADALERDGRSTFVFAPLSRDLKSPSDGQTGYRFDQDRGNHAEAIRADINRLTLGDLWAMTQARAAARELKTRTVAEAARIAATMEDDPPPGVPDDD